LTRRPDCVLISQQDELPRFKGQWFRPRRSPKIWRQDRAAPRSRARQFGEKEAFTY